MINETLSETCSYISSNYGDNTDNIMTDIFSLAGQKYSGYEMCRAEITYEEIQSVLSKINEKESIRKSKGVYYTPNDVVNFILCNSAKLSIGKLTRNNISNSDIVDADWKDFCLKKSIFDPTCGAGEFLLAAINLKFDLLEKTGKANIKEIIKVIKTINGNDINPESTQIAMIRLYLCIIHRYGYIHNLSNILIDNFENIDFVSVNCKEHQNYDVIIGNPPYVEDAKSGLNITDKYGNIYANVLVNASNILKKDRVMGFIIPLSYVSTPRMEKLRSNLAKTIQEQWILNYADRPDCLFASVHQKLTSKLEVL